MSFFSVVIPAHNAASFIGDQLRALTTQRYSKPFDVIVVDNNSTDTTLEIVSSFSESLDLWVVSATDGNSASYARNAGAYRATGEFVVFVDADDVAHPGLLDAYSRAATSYDVMGGHYDETMLNPPAIAAWRAPVTTNGLPTAYGKIPFFLMGNAAIRRSVFVEIGGLDESLAHGGEEIDFSIRALLAGYEIGWVPDAVVHYRHRTTLRGLSLQFYDYGRAATCVYTRYRHVADLPRTTRERTFSVLRTVIPNPVDLARSSTLRGEWVRLASFYGGEAVESLRRRVWHLGA